MELQDSIRRIGLMHPIVLRQTEDSVIVLVAEDVAFAPSRTSMVSAVPLLSTGRLFPEARSLCQPRRPHYASRAQRAELEKTSGGSILPGRNVLRPLLPCCPSPRSGRQPRQASSDSGDLAEELKGTQGNSSKRRCPRADHSSPPGQPCCSRHSKREGCL